MTDDATKEGLVPIATPADQLRQEIAVFHERQQITPLLRPGLLCDDIREKLAAAVAAGSPVVSEIALQLHRLRDLQLGAEEAGTVIRAAANYVVTRYVADRERGGKLSREQLDNIDVPDIPTKTFAREFAVALANQVRWKSQEVARQRQSPASSRECALADLHNRSTWTVQGTSASNVDLLELAMEFPNVDVNRLRRMLVDKFAELGTYTEPGTFLSPSPGRTFRIPVSLTAAMDAVRSDLLLEVFGPSTSQISGPWHPTGRTSSMGDGLQNPRHGSTQSLRISRRSTSTMFVGFSMRSRAKSAAAAPSRLGRPTP